MFKHKKRIFLLLMLGLVLFLAVPTLGFVKKVIQDKLSVKGPAVKGNPIKPLTLEKEVQIVLAHLQRVARDGDVTTFMSYFSDDYMDGQNQTKLTLEQSFSQFASKSALRSEGNIPSFLLSQPRITVTEEEATVQCQLFLSGESNAETVTNTVPETFTLQKQGRGWKIVRSEQLAENLQNVSIAKANKKLKYDPTKEKVNPVIMQKKYNPPIKKILNNPEKQNKN